MKQSTVENGMLRLTAGRTGTFLQVENLQNGLLYQLEPPAFEVDNKSIGGSDLEFTGKEDERMLLNGGTEIRLGYGFAGNENMKLKLIVRIFPDSPVMRYRYSLASDSKVSLTKTPGKDNIRYTGIKQDLGESMLTEIQFSQFESIVHSFIPGFEKKSEDELKEGCSYPGPITLIEQDNHCCLLAFEHGAEYPDTYLAFKAQKYGEKLELLIDAVKGNYYSGQVVDNDHAFDSVWFQFALSSGKKEDLLKHYREFFLKFICENPESRKPYIFYNTWNYQERNRNFKGLPYLYSMNFEHIMKEIDIAHRMGVDVFVIDTGWFNKTGDWIVNPEKFPDGMREVKRKLESYGMKLGLWFNPIVAAKTSEEFLKHPEYVMTNDGKENFWGKIWETEESYGMCLVSGHSDYFIKKLVELRRELGVTYFKWDAIGQYGCNSSIHDHGTEANTPQERRECYSYKMGLEMIRIVEEVTRQCPDVIVDFDITEGGRFVGLGFLSVGKYFLMNNGPYAMDFDLPEDFNYLQKEPVKLDRWTNMFFYPGTARNKICRQGARFDSFVPSILFLTHFLPDAPKLSQMNSLGSLLLGSNGIWGDLLSLTDEDINVFRETIDKYKKVAFNVTESYPRVKGFIGSSPEIHEKIDYRESKGMVVFFTRADGEFVHTTGKVDPGKFTQIDGADSYELTPDNRLKIKVALKRDEARLVFIS